MQKLKDFRDALTARRNRTVLLLACFILWVPALRAYSDELLRQFRWVPSELFFGPRDIFGDVLKSGLSYHFIADAYVRSGQYLAWPPIYQSYLLHNPYNANLSNLWSPPLTAMVLMATAWLTGIVGPGKAVGVLIALYGCGVAGVCVASRKWTRATDFDAVALALVLMLSYPAIFMLTRGNLASGYTTLGLCLYAFSLKAGRLRWLGWLGLGLAVNMRPNVAVFALMEFVAAHDMRRAILRVALAAATSILVLVVCHLVVASVYAEYSFSVFLDHLKLYNQSYLIGSEGDKWNNSLFGLTKDIRFALHYQDRYSPQLAQLVILLGAAIMAAILYLLARRKLTMLETVFLAAMFCANFTPVFGTYHLLEYVAVMGLLLSDLRDGRGLAVENRLPILVSTALVLCPLGGALTNGAIGAAQTLAAGLLLLARAFRRGQSTRSAASA